MSHPLAPIRYSLQRSTLAIMCVVGQLNVIVFIIKVLSLLVNLCLGDLCVLNVLCCVGAVCCEVPA